ncbi:hypothetical protein [Flavisphingomonas formosensis]|uniref:hypothetical protein n=1 Tax=Flavisphingomonas formosensis TaxID=861534 RepID=UPI0012FC44BC|nr:hypothetical protein [Sphingomonas formosensis]
MKKLGTLSVVALATVLSAASAQAATAVRPNTAVWGSTSLLASDARVTSTKSKKVSRMFDDSGKYVAGAAALGATGLLIWALTDKHHDHCESPGGSCNN